MTLHDRRAFLRAAASAGAAWAVANLAQVDEALAWAGRQMDMSGPPPAARLSVLSKSQAEALDAAASRILPAVDGRPGAHDAGVIYFVDRALATFNAGQRGFYKDGIADLDRRARRRQPEALFAALPEAAQDDVLREIEKTPFFAAIRMDTIVGTFAVPGWGGNRDFAGWRMIGLDHQPSFQPPFGEYDADAARRS